MIFRSLNLQTVLQPNVLQTISPKTNCPARPGAGQRFGFLFSGKRQTEHQRAPNPPPGRIPSPIRTTPSAPEFHRLVRLMALAGCTAGREWPCRLSDIAAAIDAQASIAEECCQSSTHPPCPEGRLRPERAQAINCGNYNLFEREGQIRSSQGVKPGGWQTCSLRCWLPG